MLNNRGLTVRQILSDKTSSELTLTHHDPCKRQLRVIGKRTTPTVSIQSNSLEDTVYSVHGYVHPDIYPEWHVNLPSWGPFALGTTFTGHLPATNIAQQRNVELESLNYRRLPPRPMLVGDLIVGLVLRARILSADP